MSEANGSTAAHLAAAKEAFESGDLALCRCEALKAESVDPDNKDVHRWLARLSYRAREWQALRKHAVAFLAAVPDDREMAQLKGRACLALKLWQEAADTWLHVTRLRPEWAEGWYQLTRSLAKAGDVYRARASAIRLRELGNTSALALVTAAHVFLELDDLPAAAEAYEHLGKNDPELLGKELPKHESREDLRGCAVVIAALRRSEVSGDLRQKLGDLSDNLIRRAIAAERAGKLSEALLDYSAAALLSPDDPLAARSGSRLLQKLHDRADTHVKAGDAAGAVAIYEEIVRTSPGNLKTATQLAKLHMQTHEWARAAAVWRHLTEERPDNPQYALFYARCLERSGELDTAHRAWIRLGKLDPGNQEAANALSKIPGRLIKAAQTAIAEGRYPGAWKALCSVPEGCPEHEGAQRRLAQLGRYARKKMRAAYKVGRYLDVVENGTVAVQVMPNDLDLARMLAKAAMRVSNFAAAAAAWRRALAPGSELAPQDQLNYARCCIETCAFDDAEAAVRAVLLQDPGNERARELELDLRESKLAHKENVNFDSA